jgi:DNA polymerase I-like protein with 3'-5' exonuclease and polymerase domains
MIAPRQHSIQDSPPDDLLAKLRKRLNYRWREVTKESAIDPAVALERGYRLETTKRGLERLGFKRSQQRAPALVIPRFSPCGEPIPPQIKPDNPLVEERNGKSRPRKYETPAGSGIRLSVPPRVLPMMRDVQRTLYITEGDKKADAVASVSACCIALQGVECWRVLEDWEGVKLYGREVVIAFDADVMVNPNVQKALQGLAAFLRERGALVKYLFWPERYRGTKVGIDDYLAAGGSIADLYKTAQEYPDIEAIPVGIMLSEVQAETVEWLWERRIPLGKITVLDGDPDNGKSVLTTDLAARVTTGRPMPYGFGKTFPQAGVVILSAEDGVGDTIRPRFDAAGGDPNKVVILGNEDPFGIPEDLPKLSRAIERVGARLVVIDPIMAFLGENINSNSDKDVRSALKPLKQLAERSGAAVVIVRHLNKTPGGNVLYRGGGSIGIIGAARSGLVVGPHPTDEGLRVLASQKHNLSMPPESLAYQVTSAPNNPHAAVIVYKGVTEMNAKDILKPQVEEQERSAMDEAKDFLREVLAAGEKPAADVKSEAESVGVAWGTLKRAKVALGVNPVKRGTVWYWSLSPDDCAEDGFAGALPATGSHDPVDPLAPSTNSNGHLAGKWIKDDPDDPLGPADPTTTTITTEKKAYISQFSQVDQVDHLDQTPSDDLRTNDTSVTTEAQVQVDHQVDQGDPVDPLAYYVHDSAADALAPLIEEMRATKGPVALDTETFDPTLGPEKSAEDGDALDVRVARVRLIQVKTADGVPHVVDAAQVDVSGLLGALRDKPVIAHNAAYDLAVLRNNYGYIHDGPVFDTMLAAKVFYAGMPNAVAGYKELLERLLEVEISKDEQSSDWSAAELSPEQLRYAASDVEYLDELAHVLRTKADCKGLGAVLDLENRMVMVVSEMSALGMPVDEAVFSACVRESEDGVAEQTAKLDSLITEPLPDKFVDANTKNKNVPEERNERVNWKSHPQALWALKSAGLDVASTAKKVLAEYEGNPLADALGALRKVGDVATRFRGTKVQNGRAHAKWKQLEAATGRMACEKPPLQGIPQSLKRAFAAPAGHKLIVSDLSQIEVRVLAALSGDDKLRQEFIEGRDIHKAVAANVLGIPREAVTPEQRKLAKALVFGLLYGQGLKGFADKAREVFKKDYSEREVEKRFWQPFFDAYPGVARWREDAINRFKSGRKDTYTALGRRRLHLEKDTQALNSPIQGGAADVMKSIAVAVYGRRCEVAGLEIVGLVHDEILATVPEEYAAAAATLIHEVMKEVGEEVTNISVDEDRRVPVEAKTKVCDCWAQKE